MQIIGNLRMYNFDGNDYEFLRRLRKKVELYLANNPDYKDESIYIASDDQSAEFSIFIDTIRVSSIFGEELMKCNTERMLLFKIFKLSPTCNIGKTIYKLVMEEEND